MKVEVDVLIVRTVSVDVKQHSNENIIVVAIVPADDELMLNVLRCHLTY